MSELPSAANLSPEVDTVKNGTSIEAWLRPNCLQWTWELFPNNVNSIYIFNTHTKISIQAFLHNHYNSSNLKSTRI